MWARIVELMIAIWMALSPFIFRYPAEETFFWINSFLCAFLTALFALLSFWRPLRKIHLLTIAIALWSWGFGYSTFPQRELPMLENSVVMGLLLCMLAIVPSQSDRLSPSWQEFINKRFKI